MNWHGVPRSGEHWRVQAGVAWPGKSKGSSDHMNKYPFDTDHLAKGDTIQADVIEGGYGVKRGDERYRWTLLRARKFVARQFKERGEIVTIVIRGDSLKICTDDEQLKPNMQSIVTGQRKIRRGHGRMVGADRSKMSPEVLAKHDRVVEVTGRKLAAMRHVVTAELPAATARTTPGRKRLRP